jgi:hypothetical protein
LRCFNGDLQVRIAALALVLELGRFLQEELPKLHDVFLLITLDSNAMTINVEIDFGRRYMLLVYLPYIFEVGVFKALLN